jgi:hypothetical protein
VDVNGFEIWAGPDDMRCIMRPQQHYWQLCLLREDQVLKSDLFIDAAAAFVAADAWRRNLHLAGDD